jgi:SAM-dependent methyltransferase
MDASAYELLQSEQSWWYRGRAHVVSAALARAKVQPVENALDFGAGYGGMSEHLAEHARNVFAFEPHADARAMAEKRAYKAVLANENDVFARRWDLVGLFDVVEHIEDDRAFLTRLRGSLGDRGLLAITVPAFQFLWSSHDVNLHHFRRYTRTTLAQVLDETGYEIAYMSYWNAALFIPAALMRMIGRSGESGLGLPGIIDSTFFGLVMSETVISRVLRLPFGTGLVAIARKRISAG